MGLGLAGLRRAPNRPTWSAMSTTSRLENSSRQLVGRLARKVESDSPVGIPGAPGRLVTDLKTELGYTHKRWHPDAIIGPFFFTLPVLPYPMHIV
jgi:hypothetical protein